MDMSSFRFGALALALTLSAACGVPAALAQSCNDDIGKMSQERQAAMKTINDMVAAAKGKQMDPSAFCVKAAPLNAIEVKLLAYLQKNQDWCAIPDAFIDQLKAAHAKSVAFSGKACKVAAEMKKMKEAGASGNGPAAAPQLPAGPL